MAFINIKPEPSFERIRKTLLLEGKADRAPLCDFLIDYKIMEAIVGRSFEIKEYGSGNASYKMPSPKDQLDFWYLAGYDYVHMRPYYNFDIFDIKESFKSIEGIGAIQSTDELHSRIWPWQRHDDFGYCHIADMARILPEDMKLIISTGDIFTWTWEVMGFTYFCTSLYECPELIEELFMQFGEAIYLLNKRTVELVGDKIGALWYTDDLAFNTGTFVNPEVYRKYLFPWVRKISDLAKSLNVPFLYHTDGRLWSVFEDFADLGVNAIQPLEPKSMDAQEVKEKWGNKFCLVGNIDVDRLSRGTPDEIDAMVKDRIEKLGYNGGYCVGSSNTVPDYVNPVNFKAMVEASFKYKY